MNKKIESLANVWANRRREEEGLGIVYVFTEKALQVFAEKIVKECAQLARDTDLGDVDGGDQSVLRAAKMQILEHFGVEE